MISGEWKEADYRDEYWSGDPQVLRRPQSMEDLLKALPRRGRRDALRALRGSILRTEVYALDGTQRQPAPYTVTEALYGVREESPLDAEVDVEGASDDAFSSPILWPSAPRSGSGAVTR